MPNSTIERFEVRIGGRVQGVGFRPYVYRCATALGLAGRVRNTPSGVRVLLETTAFGLSAFLEHLHGNLPPLARIDSTAIEAGEPEGLTDFVIEASGSEGGAGVFPADAATCPDCLAEFHSPADRRFGYPFINCTNCGPRFTLIERLPYDRERTTMRAFPLCPECEAEYRDPGNRRYHAEPVACPMCGPAFRLIDAEGEDLPGDPLETAIELLRNGAIVAVKGLGGYHLACDAANAGAVSQLRCRKQRPDKPFALLVRDLDAARRICHVNEAETDALASPAAPIVLLCRRGSADGIAAPVAPGTNLLGVMLPSAPHHHTLAAAFPALVMTSGNLSDEPLVSTEAELARLLGPVADAALIHNRPIAHKCDDSIVRFLGGAPVVLRRARGFVPDPLPLPARSAAACVLAFGADIKSAFAFAHGGRAILSQHLGDLDDVRSVGNFEAELADYLHLFDAAPTAIAHDRHPDYHSTRLARLSGISPAFAIAHHHAHFAACLAENEREGPALGVIYDGAGFGPDGTIWGGEILAGDLGAVRRVAHWSPTPLPGGDAAVREPWRMTLSFLLSGGDGLLARAGERFVPLHARERAETVKAMIQRRIRSPLTSSAGRLFDAFAAFLGLTTEQTFEGQGPMALEAIADPAVTDGYPAHLVRAADAEDGAPGPWILSSAPMWEAAVADRAAHRSPRVMAARFHHGLAEATAEACERLARETGLRDVVLSGGCFQNEYLTRSLAARLEARGLRPVLHRRVPPNDGGIAYGQLAIALRWLASGREVSDPCVSHCRAD